MPGSRDKTVKVLYYGSSIQTVSAKDLLLAMEGLIYGDDLGRTSES